MSIFNPSVEKLENGIQNCAKTQQDIAKNIANLSNPNYVPKTFDKELAEAQGRLDRKVLIEDEMTKMSKNSVHYNTYVKLLTMRYQNIRKVVTLGK
ncbi:MAG: hypothetical protein A2X41_06525 [Candidatus Margulisbacteria bacterium GWE2_39_32]|nr:MAG: hypothetical protein A2X41_06525 [Candidatus Margulisbacteria bacterium GWE2_39_32]